ncbi:hypothetical protein IGI04_006686 [Brassica rapa subsp. trilocularis]|uniref:Uncharacterized protein n=1 Tax=Brassica rapa subsp. trilocularis TaxID=1813537 RepID=A0ABQ7NHK1_BRACM|nr:hypothetical protein IGI04_006686 [Brassica rapa subsp. trilocularis]
MMETAIILLLFDRAALRPATARLDSTPEIASLDTWEEEEELTLRAGHDGGYLYRRSFMPRPKTIEAEKESIRW